MQYLKPKWSEVYGGVAYSKGWEATFAERCTCGRRYSMVDGEAVCAPCQDALDGLAKGQDTGNQDV